MQAYMYLADQNVKMLCNNMKSIIVLLLLITAWRSELPSEPSPAVTAISTE